MTELTVAMLMVAGLLTFLDWRKGLAMCVVVGILQDPLRKLAPGQPVYYVVLVGAIFAVAWGRAAMAHVPLGPSSMYGWRKSLRGPFTIFFLLIVVQAFHSLARYGNLLMPTIGMMVWLAPIPAIVLAYQFATRRGIAGVRKFMLLYSVLALISLSGVYLEYIGYDWATLGEVGVGQVIYDVGTVLKAHSGFFRASEIAAWHTAAIACFVFILSVGKRATLLRIAVAVGLIALLVSLGLLTGRRKLLVEITVFISVYFFLVAWLQRGTARIAIVVLAAGAIGYVLIVGFVSPDVGRRPSTQEVQLENPNGMEGYKARGQSVFGDVPGRVNQLGVQPIMWSINRFGWMGAGLGTGTQGTDAIASQYGIGRGAAEGGLGKVTMELGAPGLLVVAWLVMTLAKYLRAQLAALGKVSPQHARMAYGLTAFLVANAATFSVATQAYSDLFVLLILGWSLGFLFAMPVLAARGDGLKRRAATLQDFASTQGPETLPMAGVTPAHLRQ
ncbi:MAG: hypothetical protein H7255_04375 [Ramlibacter sp.]|nr:hypothetical protein [Ramlibacter sp.]